MLTQAQDERFANDVIPQRPLLFGLALRLSGCQGLADDLVQETVLRAWLFWPRFERDGNVRAWLGRILWHAFADAHRRRRREHANERRFGAAMTMLGPMVATAEPNLGYSDEVELALSELHPEARRLVTLVDAEGLTYSEAAAALGRPIGTVMSRLSRARQRLRGSLAHLACH